MYLWVPLPGSVGSQELTCPCAREVGGLVLLLSLSVPFISTLLSFHWHRDDAKRMRTGSIVPNWPNGSEGLQGARRGM